MQTLFKHNTAAQKDFERLNRKYSKLSRQLKAIPSVVADATKDNSSGGGGVAGSAPSTATIPIVTKYLVTSDYTVGLPVTLVLVDSTSSVTISLFNSMSYGESVITIKKIGTGAVTIDPYMAELIDGQSNKIISGQYDSITIRGYGGNWYIL